MLKLAIVAALYNSNEILEGFIKSISNQTEKNYELYLVDNSPNNETDELLQKLTNKYTVSHVAHIKNPHNLGATGGNNVGIKAALKNGCDLILMSNVDIRFTDEHLFDKAIQLFQSSKENIVVPKIYTAANERVWMAGGTFNILLAKVKHYGYEAQDLPKYSISRYVKYAPNTFMFVRKEVFDNVGLFDENYLIYFDDLDFVYRCYLKRYKVFYWPQVNVEHLVSYSTKGSLSTFSLYHSAKNRIYFMRKSVPFYKRFITLPYILSLNFLRMLSYNKIQRKAMLKGMIEGFKVNKA